MPKVSVIIPVYNAEGYLRGCLDSIVSQTLKDIEIICINDCSTDRSLSILKEYAQKDKRIKIIDFEVNKGVGIARNTGIDRACGKYIGFVDSDDFIDSDFYEKLYNKTKETDADAVKGNIYNYNNETGITELTAFYDMNNKIKENQLYFYYGFTSAIYKKDFINQFNIRFPQNINYFEDPYFSISACLNYKNLSFVEDTKYYYRQHTKNSSSNHLTESNFKDFHSVALKIIHILNNKKLSKENYLIIFKFLYNFVLNNYYNTQVESALREYMFDIIVEMLLASKYQLQIPGFLYKKFLENVMEGKYYDTILKEYKNYDYINKEKTLIKILVSYIKPSFLFKTDILTPIHLGRSVEKEISKDGIANDDDIKWLHENCIGDNNFKGNISHLNRRIGFFTGTFWAWKNYEKLGNPDFFGSFGYRRLLFPNCLNNIQHYDFIIPHKKEFKETLKHQVINAHGQLCYDAIINVMNCTFPEQINDLNNYFNKTEGYYAELYIMKKKILFEYCDWIYKIIKCLFKLYPDFLEEKNKRNFEAILSDFIEEDLCINTKTSTAKEVRDLAFIIERLTGFYLYLLTQNNLYKYKEVAIFEPYLTVKNIPIAVYKQKVLNKMRENVKKSFGGKNATGICNNTHLQRG